MLKSQTLVAFLATRDEARARTFYEQVLGLSLVSNDPYAMVFDANGTTLRIQKVDDLQPPPHTALGWQVADIASIVDSLAQRGVTMARYDGLTHDSRGIWTSPSGARIAWFHDPDGNTLSLTQL